MLYKHRFLHSKQCYFINKQFFKVKYSMQYLNNFYSYNAMTSKFSVLICMLKSYVHTKNEQSSPQIRLAI